jgi:hypothetical protein
VSRAPGSTRLTVPILLTLGLLAARVVAAPPLSDPVGGGAAAGLHLSVPWAYAALAPLFTLWDGASMLGMSRLRGLLVGCALLYALWRVARAIQRGTSWRREVVTAALSLAAFVAFIAGGALWHRPMLSLAGVQPEDVVVDYHSHTNRSRDVRKTAMRRFDLRANLRWHARAGFDAAFVTDHNEPPEVDASTADANHLTYGCPGTEVSAWNAHIVLLGRTPRISRDVYARTLDGLLTLLRTSDSTYGALSIASLPEYERSHWDRLEQLTAAGLDGFEIVNAAPKASELSRARRDSVIALARRTHRLLVGVSDSHGWGATSMAWNLVPLPGWRVGVGSPCDALLAQLRVAPESNRIVERHRLRADAFWPLWLTPVGVVWETWRGMGWLLTASWLAWTWIGWLWLSFRRPPRMRSTRSKRSTSST